jgi:hypothetical protein
MEERDVYEDDPDGETMIVEETRYGQLLAIYEYEFGPFPRLKITGKELFLLGLIRPCPTDGFDASADVVLYSKADFQAETTVIIDLMQVENVVGRVELPERRAFGIVDRVMGSARPVFVLDEDERVVAA